MSHIYAEDAVNVKYLPSKKKIMSKSYISIVTNAEIALASINSS